MLKEFFQIIRRFQTMKAGVWVGKDNRKNNYYAEVSRNMHVILLVKEFLMDIGKQELSVK